MFKTKAAADHAVASLSAKGLGGYVVEAAPKSQFEVEHPYQTHSAADHARAALRGDGFKHALVERG